MKINTTEPRIPLHRLKHPVKPKILMPAVAAESEVEKEDESEFSNAFERTIVKNGAREFKKWLDELGIK